MRMREITIQYDAVPLLPDQDTSDEDETNFTSDPRYKTVVTNDGPVVLKRQLGLASCISVIVGSAIGSGIFVSPKGILQEVPNVNISLVLWVVCGIVNTLGALSYGELGTTYSKSGGDYIYLLESFGPMIGFLRIWTSLVAVRTGSIMVVLLTASVYILKPLIGSTCEDLPEVAIRLITAVLTCCLFYINCVSVKWTSRIQQFLTVAKVLGLITIIVPGIYLFFKGHRDHFNEGFQSDIQYANLPLALYSGMYAYSGWQSLPQLTEEIQKPQRTIPLSIIISMVLITSLYLLVNISYFTVLSAQDVLNSEAVALAYWQAAFSQMLWVVAMIVTASCIGSANGSIFSTSRMYFASSREGQLPTLFSMIHINYKTPVPAILIMVPFCLLCLTSNSIYSLINYLSFTKWLFLGLSAATIPYNRWKHPEWKRPFKVPLFVPVTFVVFCFFLVSMSLYSAPVECGVGLLLMLSGIPVYLIGVGNGKGPVNHRQSSLSLWLQKLLLIVQEEKSTYKSYHKTK
ncbi:cystine/glutamate transporter-like [Anneissia japonica]|uniref:cystine/glutamate transporter-like n=1 Tax=Anneissia japonica TaxID=1529436 RepID=UPI0014256B76|nr:cystine/glutamate transporter-like [Anneissia japonica]XP_033115408.1 cystine/glutamate transporter-like [Anneissia japonica]